ncbi:MAG: TGS domain-containing protein [Proteobacteria bacterium]|nr:TGS domain-containing protein [Pseudomonadota bacterium]
MPGMLPFEDVHFQLVDLPPISKDYMDSWLVNALQSADAALLIVDISDPECTDHVVTIRERLDEKKITLSGNWPGLNGHAADERNDDQETPDPFRIYLPTLLVANKMDLNPNPEDLTALEELTGGRFPAVATSIQTGENLQTLGSLLFRGLQVVRVYTKMPGKPPEMNRPFTVRSGATVLDVARLVHKDLAGAFKYARAWGNGVFDGQQVGPEHLLADADIVELHIR